MSGSSWIIPDAFHPPYQLPLDGPGFEAAIQRGHGRAYLHSKKYGLDGLDNPIIHACTHNLRYDSQCEDASQDWLVHLITQAKAQEIIFPRILDQIDAALASTNTEEIPRNFLAGMLYEIVKKHSLRARELLYRIHSDLAPDYTPPPGTEEIISMDGHDGLIRVFDRLGILLERDQLEKWSIESSIGAYDRHHVEGDGLVILKAMAESNPMLHKLLEFHESDDPPGSSASGPGTHQTGIGDYRSLPRFQDRSDKKKDAARFQETTAEEVIQWVHNAPDSNYAAWIRRWAIHAPKEAIFSITQELLVDENPHHIHKYLRAFTRRCPMTLIDDRLLALVDHTSSKIRLAAYDAFATCNDPRIRSLALRKLNPDNLKEGSLALFTSTYQPGDHSAIENALFHIKDQFEIHTIGFSLIDIFNERNTPESLNSMLYVYEHGPCMNCRHSAIKIMQDAGITPDWVIQEAKHDADSGIRELVTGSENLY